MIAVDAELRRRLQEFASAHVGGDAVTVTDIEDMPGHSGVSYGFTIRRREGGSERSDRYVLRLAPPGVRLEGPADVVRQARLLRSLAGTGVPVPWVAWHGDDPQWFGRPYFVMVRVPGSTLVVRDQPPENAPDTEGFRHRAQQAIDALLVLHRLDWRAHAPERTPVGLSEAVTHWDRFWKRSADPELVRAAPALRDELLARVPAAPRIGLTHGDFQWANLLYDGERLAAVLDWELAGVGAVLNDLGWLMVFSDPESWAHTSLWASTPPPDLIAETYADRAGFEVREVAWHRALAGYTFGIIAGFNLMLHRRGKRVDPHYEMMVPSIPRLIERAAEVLGA